MTPDDRRYSDDDARRILALAAEVDASARSQPWTLAELQRVGQEAGLAPDAVAVAARAVARHPMAGDGPGRPGHWLGLPVAVSHSVPLARPMSDADWERLVSSCRDTFAASGRTRIDGRRREWGVGNLRVTHVATDDGALLEFRTRKGDARLLPQFGLLALAVAAILAIVGTAGSRVPTDVSLLFAALGGACMAAGFVRLPAWARARERQFATLAADAQRLTGR